MGLKVRDLREFNVGLEQIRKKLLDLSKRNRLINYRRPHKSKNLKIIDESPEFIYKFLVKDERSFRFKSIPYPTQMPEYLSLVNEQKEVEELLVSLSFSKKKIVVVDKWNKIKETKCKIICMNPSKVAVKFQKYRAEKEYLEERLNEVKKKIEKIEAQQNFSVESQAKAMNLVVSSEMPEIELDDKNNFDIHIDDFLQTLHYADELEKVLKNIEQHSRSIMEVTGSNMLYLILGVLEWREKDDTEKVIKSPLITIPVSLTRMRFNDSTNTYEYKLMYTGDIIETNESLSHKLFADFKVKLPQLTESMSFNHYVREVQKLCVTQHGWKIRQEISLDFLQFGKVLMYKDLKNSPKLQKHKVLKDIFLGKSTSEASYAVGEYDIDKESLKKRMPLILDADSSQHSAMIDVLNGKNVVIEGPPGTGKSQIIANLIALLMYEGKKVLFVSEKLVALEVVHQRLAQVGLGDFCMELHSHKTDKITFLKSLNRRITGEYGFPFKYDKTERELRYTKQQLNKYVKTLHEPYGNNNKTIFENIWLRERFLEGEKYFLFKISNAKRLKEQDLLFCEEHLEEYAYHYADYNLSNSFWVGFEVTELSFMQSSQFITLFSKLEAPYLAISEELRLFNISEDMELMVLKNLEAFMERFVPLESYYFPFSELSTFRNLYTKIDNYLRTLLGYINASEINNLTTSEIIDALETSATLLGELAEFDGTLKPELIGFQRFVKRAKKSHEEFEEIAQRNSEYLYLPMVKQKSTEDIYEVVHTVQEKRDSWFRFFSSAYKKALRSFSAMLKEKLPEQSAEWTFLLRELSVYTLNRENEMKLRLTLIEKVPLFIKNITNVHTSIKKSLDSYEFIYQSNIEEPFKQLLYSDIHATNKFDTLLKQGKKIEEIYEALKPYGLIQNEFWGDSKNSVASRLKKLKGLEEHKSKLSSWISFQQLLKKLKEMGLKEMMLSAERKEIPKEKLVDTFYFNYYNSLLNEAFLEYSVLENFSRLKHDALVQKFQRLDKKYIKQSRTHIANELSQKELPASKGEGRVATFTNLKLLKHEIGKKKRHVPIRQLLSRAGEAIHTLKPCFMMSPLSVAQYMPIEKTHFDVLLIDEASQLKPEESLGVIARAKQVVVVGDPKQMPPSSFFDVAQEETEASKKTVLDDSESILDSFMELYNPIRRLKWHYRSQHESLISFSNQHFYDNELTIFPSTTNEVNENLGVKYTYVEDGRYQSGNQYRINVVEAKRILEQVKHQMEFFPEKSLGVGTLNGTQQELIQELVDEAEKEFVYVSLYIEKWKSKNEAFFVKNLESLQGDERDVILISTTYGKEEGSDRVAQRFGPLNQESGWRRLNVLITRAKQKMHIFTSMLSSDIRTTESSSRGLKAFKNFLKFLEHNALKEPMPQETNESSTFANVVATLLREKGYEVVKNVGVSGYYIDLAVVSKKDGSFLLAVECDGEAYFNASSTSDRERLKIEALKRLGWNHYRVWSMEWVKNREFEFQRLLEEIEFSEEIREEEKRELTEEKLLVVENNRYSVDVERLNSITRLSLESATEGLVADVTTLKILSNANNLKLLMIPFRFTFSTMSRLAFPKIEALFLTMDSFAQDSTLNVLYELLEKQSSIKILGIKYHDKLNKFRVLPLLELLIKEFSNIDNLYFFYQSKGEQYQDYMRLERSRELFDEFVVTEFKDSSEARKYIRPKKLLNCSTLKKLFLPNLENREEIEYLLRRNEKIEVLQCLQEVVTPEILARNFKELKQEQGRQYDETYKVLKEELKEINDPKKEELIELILHEEELTFVPNKKLLIPMLQSKIILVRNRAFEIFDSYYNDTVKSLLNRNIFFGTKGFIEDSTELKEKLTILNSKMNSTINSRTDLIVLGTNNKIKDIPDDIEMISSSRFLSLFNNASQKGLSPEIFKEFRLEYELLEKSLIAIDDPNKEILLYLFLANKEVIFKPNKKTLIQFMSAPFERVKINANKLFNQYYNDNITSLEKLTIFFMSKSKKYSIPKIKKILLTIDASLNSELNEKINLIVIGPIYDLEKLEMELPLDISMISLTHFESLLKEVAKKSK